MAQRLPSWAGPLLRTVVRTEEMVIADIERAKKGQRFGSRGDSDSLLEDIELDLIALTFRWKEIRTGRPQLDLGGSEIAELFDQMADVLKARQERGRRM
jgi:hypothetical protein